MICPFLFQLEKRPPPRLDEQGFRTDEYTWEVTSLDCRQKECTLYDPSSTACSFVRLSEETRKLARDVPEQLRKGIDQSLFEKAEMLSVVVATNLDHLQAANKHFAESVTKSLERLGRDLGDALDKSTARGKEQEGALKRIENLMEQLAKRGDRLERALVDVIEYLVKAKKGRP